MRISDWSSDVCSSDLCSTKTAIGRRLPNMTYREVGGLVSWASCPKAVGRYDGPRPARAFDPTGSGSHRGSHGGCAMRSEEHTSELQSLMRISYAVFCLKKKKKRDYCKQRMKYMQRFTINTTMTQ